MRDIGTHKSMIFFNGQAVTFKEMFQPQNDYYSQGLDLLEMDLQWNCWHYLSYRWTNGFCPGVMNKLTIRELSFHTQRKKSLISYFQTSFHLSIFFFFFYARYLHTMMSYYSEAVQQSCDILSP